VEEDSYIEILEKLVRGKSLKEPNEATLKFAKTFQISMEEAGCLNSEK
jgi:hypothetical protein